MNNFNICFFYYSSSQLCDWL